MNIGYEPEVCDHCGQTTTYVLGIDRGSVDILKAISTAIRNKGINIIHPWKEMQSGQKKIDYMTMVQNGVLTAMQLTNLSRPRAHGLIAQVRDQHGNYCMTTKGADFLRGKEVPRYAIMSKSEGHQIGYFQPEKYRISIKDFRPDQEYWEGINYEIIEGQIVVPKETIVI